MNKPTELAPSQTAAATLGREGNMACGAFVVRPGNQTLKWRERQYAMLAIGVICKSGLPPPHVNIARSHDK